MVVKDARLRSDIFIRILLFSFIEPVRLETLMGGYGQTAFAGGMPTISGLEGLHLDHHGKV